MDWCYQEENKYSYNMQYYFDRIPVKSVMSKIMTVLTMIDMIMV